MENYVERLELALSGITGARDELYGIDGMDSYCKELSVIAANIEAELDELLSLGESNE